MKQDNQPQWCNNQLLAAKQFWNKRDNLTRGFFNEELYFKFLKRRLNVSEYGAKSI
jgi:hypothetical protein